jgi:3-methyladenine DNA glycosylase AlkD
MSNVNEIIEWLRSQGNEKVVAGMSRFGINIQNAFGIKMPVLRAKAKTFKKDMTLSRELWRTGFHEARIMAGFIADPKKITEKDLDEWVKDFNSWDICDVICHGVFCKTDLYDKKILEYSSNESEYVRRAAFVMITGMALQNKKLPDEVYYKYFDLIEKYAYDSRNFVKKSVNWALRQIGKRNISLGRKAIEVSERLLQQPHKSAHWIANDVIRELKSKWEF